MELKRDIILCFALVVLGGCATVPAGPSAMVLPEPGKPFEVFQSDDAVCRQYAMQQIQKSAAWVQGWVLQSALSPVTPAAELQSAPPAALSPARLWQAVRLMQPV
jgi:hypothetical protein